MEKELLKFAGQVAFIAVVAGMVASGMDKKENKKEDKARAMPSGTKWVMGIVDGPSAEPGAYAPALSMQ